MALNEKDRNQLEKIFAGVIAGLVIIAGVIFSLIKN